ncbi:PREDICTED: 5-methylcytosine rRNA methyltransferase NSUN4-like isoform X2 [Priapulus caudatus]|uniref:NOL1/NOP2/Sun domain family member 4 n=1 Tax=Priapulus caudatus TaxID=37621 RepID=A0ABM1E596_PRICU|nr:PREDICTED: 5-methylcytosine rRNA methyltransferase NSUN4-like isoform X2 [Priapulus caudatus]
MYGPYFGQEWPKIRIALQCQLKYCAVINNFSSRADDSKRKLEDLRAFNLFEAELMANRSSSADTQRQHKNSQFKHSGSFESDSYHPRQTTDAVSGRDTAAKDEDGSNASVSTAGADDAASALSNVEGATEHANSCDQHPSSSPDTTPTGNADIYDFVPATKLRGPSIEREEKFQTDYGYIFEKPREVEIVPDQPFRVPERLKAYVYKKGDLSLFPPPRTDISKILDYYLMDASSILPTLALDLKFGNTVLDLCAAPGGKTLTMLQQEDLGGLLCNDVSFSRLRRLRSVLKSYVPATVQERMAITTSHLPGDRVAPYSSFNKVLVDVPCTTDRQSMLVEDNNWFSTSRTKERHQLPELQARLLCDGIRAVKVGGIVVYSTCSLSPIQNDGVVQMALQTLWEKSSIDVVIRNLDPVQQQFEDFFSFYSGCRYGQLVVPTLLSNFGPMYFCKIERVK